MIRQVAITDFPAIKLEHPNPQVWDVRDAALYAEGHLKGAVNHPIDQLNVASLDSFPKGEPLFVLCGGGSKAGRAIAMLESLDPTRDYVELTGGTRGAIEAGLAISVKSHH
jgi:rhodanese-related sulfurtransferase